MNGISKTSIKKVMKNGSNHDLIISDRAAAAIVRILEKKAKRIAKYAVERAKTKNRATVTEDDVDAYRMRFGD